MRYARLFAHLLSGVFTVAFRYPFADPAGRLHLRQRWSAGMLRLLGVRLEAAGEAVRPGCLLVSNHVSWLDVFAINALAPSAFVSKAEVREWPILGWLAARNETVFLRRGSRGHAKIINAEIGALLDQGRNVAVFPEGTTTDGTHVLHFHAALLQPAIASGHSVQALAIRYRTTDGCYEGAPAYDGDITLGQCLAAIVARPGFVARIDVLTPIATDAQRDRRALAHHARDAIAAVVAASNPTEAPATASSPQGLRGTPTLQAGENTA